MTGAGVMMIPVLPAIEMPATLAFYAALGFEVTHHQTSPNAYAATRRGDIHLHFMGMKGLDPATTYSTCLVIVPELEQLHRTFADGLRSAYGKLPVTGVPRISRMKPGQSRFTVVDIAGNSVIFIHRESTEATETEPRTHTRLETALRTATRLRDFKNDDSAAAKVLDAALRRPEPGAPVERARVLAARIELAIALGDTTRAAAVRADLATLVATLTDADRAHLASELDAIEALDELVAR